MKPFMYNHERVREKFGKLIASMNLPLGFTQDPRVLDLMEIYNRPLKEFLRLLLIMI